MPIIIATRVVPANPPTPARVMATEPGSGAVLIITYNITATDAEFEAADAMRRVLQPLSGGIIPAGYDAAANARTWRIV